ncbi:MAG TPA: HAMP domain-containing sensor histidine kinase [Thermomicrobiaceae bacterium]|nr:HAMP domain-containing sensor histidine kinase [Thermomicrobiaceae bacterium]
MDILDLDIPPIPDAAGRGTTIDREPDEQRAVPSRLSSPEATETPSRARQHPYRRARRARRHGQWAASVSLVFGAAGAAAVCWLLLRLLAARAPGLVSDLGSAMSFDLLFTAVVTFLVPRDRFPYGTWAIGAGLLAVTLSFSGLGTGHAPALAAALSVDAALAASYLFWLASRPRPMVVPRAGHPFSSACVPVVLSAVAGFALLHRESGSVTAQEIAATVSLAIACLAVAAVLQLRAVGRAPGWLLWSLATWAACQLQLALALATHRSWPDPGFQLAFASAITLGTFVDLRSLTSALEVPAGRTVGRARSPVASPSRDDEFVKLLAHELGSPLAAIRTWAHFIASDPALPERHEKTVRGIQREVAALDVLVADMRGATAVPGVMFGVRPRPTSIADIMDEAVHFAESLPGRHAVITDITADQQVLADPSRIGQVLRNLLSNADNYSEPESPIILRAEPCQASVRIEVIDHGVGIREDERDRIFKKFDRGQTVDRQSVPGMGVGLFVAQSIVQAHGSQIHLASVPGRGSRFAFDLRIVS